MSEHRSSRDNIEGLTVKGLNMKKWTEIETGKTHSAFQHIMVALGEKADGVVDRINTDPAFAKRLAAYAINEDLEPVLSPIRAQQIMGKNFFGFEEAVEHLGISPTCRQFVALWRIPFTEAVLQQCTDTHILVAVFPLSILEIRGKDSTLFHRQEWYDEESFATERGEVNWRLVRKTPVGNSLSYNWSDQQALISKDDEVPTAQVMVYTIIGHFLATGERLFEKVYVHTSSVDSDGGHVSVGGFLARGLYVSNGWVGSCGDCLGIASARKFN